MCGLFEKRCRGAQRKDALLDYRRTAVSESRDRLQQMLATSVIAPVDRLRAQLDLLSQVPGSAMWLRARDLAEDCATLARSRVREMSSSVAQFRPTLVIPPNPVVSWRTASGVAMVLSVGIPVVAVSGLVAMFRIIPEISFGPTVAEGVLRSVMQVGVCAAYIAGVNAAGSSAWARRLPRGWWLLVFRAAALTGLWAVAAAAVVASRVLLPTGFTGPAATFWTQGQPWMDAAWVPWLAVVGVVMSGAISSVRVSQDDLDRSSRDIQVAIEQVEGELLAYESSIARLLHGPVQSRLIAASLALSSAAQQGDMSESLRRVSGELSSVIDEVLSWPDRESALPLLARVQEVSALWDGFLRVSFSADDDCLEMCDRREVLSNRLVEAVAELCTNSVHHGGAGALVVNAVGCDAGIRVRARDDGAGLARGPSEQVCKPDGSVWVMTDRPAGGVVSEFVLSAD